MGNKRIYFGREFSKYAEIADGAIITVTSLFFVLMVMGFEITGSDDICLGTMDDPCVSYGKICNLGPDNYDIYNPDEVKLDFSPTIKNHWIFFKDGRVKKQFLYGIGVNHSTVGWRYENFTDATKPRSDRVYVHRFARYNCQEYMLVGLKENPDDIIKWGVGVGAEYLDPFWYGVEDETANISVSTSMNLELGSRINITTNLSGASTVCVDIDHPEYGDNYTCGSPNANFTFNVSYFRRTEFNDSSTVKTIEPPYPLNATSYDGGGYSAGVAFESCANFSFNTSGTLRITIYIWETGPFAWNASTTTAPRIRIRDTNMDLLEEIISENNSGLWDKIFYADNFYESGEYGICLVKPNASGSTGFDKASYISGFTSWPHYELDLTTGELKSNFFNDPPRLLIQSTSETLFIDSHSVDDVKDLTVNITGIELAENVKIYVNGTLANSLGHVYNTSEGNISTFNSSELNLVNINSTIFSIPKEATILNTTINFTGKNITWEISNYWIPETGLGVLGSPSHGTASWYHVDITYAWDENTWSATGPWLTPLYGIVYTAILYKNYTIDSDNIFGNVTTYYLSYPDAPFISYCWDNSSWVELINNATAYDTANPIKNTTVTLPGGCLIPSLLRFKTILEYDGTSGIIHRSLLAEDNVKYYRYGFPEDMKMEVGYPDGVYEYQDSGELTGSDGATNFIDSITDFLVTCTADADGFCDVPIYFISDDGGSLSIDSLEIIYTYSPNPVDINNVTVQNFANSSLFGEISIPITFSAESGSFNISDLRYDYAGGNDTIEIFAWEAGNTSNNETLSLNIYFSKFINLFPSFIEYLEFIPKSYVDQDVEPYGQSTSRPIFNISNYGYGGKKMNFSIYVNGTNSCVNITINTNSTKPSSGSTTSDFQFYDDFESDFGHWATHEGIGCDNSSAWGGRATSTPSAITGPQSGGVGGAGTYFIYVETSTGGGCYDSGDQALVYFNTTIDYDSCSDGNITFYFNAYGANIDKLALEENSTGSWIELWNMSDLNIDYWNFTRVDLSSLTGSGTLRFNYTRTSTGYQSDVALDRINVTYSLIETSNNTLGEYWLELFTDFSYQESEGLWMWVDMSCNYTSWQLFNPDFYFRACCEDCICSEGLA